MDAVKIAIIGDIYVSPSIQVQMSQCDLAPLFGNLPQFFEEFDFVVGNLELPLTTRGLPIDKGGPNLRADPMVIPSLKGLGLSAVGLANNHILDYGTEGVEDTLSVCASVGIETFGAGLTLRAARSPLIVNIKGRKIAFIGFAENEYSIASNTSAGANPVGHCEMFNDLKLLRQTVDGLIVLYHGGIEHYQYPSPELRRLCRSFIDSGVDFISCQHSHCIGAEEKYLGKTILYGQGNFLFSGMGKHSNEWSYGLVAEVNVDDWSVDFTPIRSVGYGVDIADSELASEILYNFSNRSSQISQPGFVEFEWQKYCLTRADIYMGMVLGFNKIFYLLNRLLRGALVRFFFRRKDLQNTLNIIRCESHREVLLEVLRTQVERRSGE
jgi:hypothetical protein